MREAFIRRRRRLLELVGGRSVMLWSGELRPRNSRAIAYPFRGNSHSLYCSGVLPPRAVTLLTPDRSTLFLDPVSEDNRVWLGDQRSLDLLAGEHGFDEVLPRSELARCARASGALTIDTLDTSVRAEQEELLGKDAFGVDLIDAMITLRLRHDDYALGELRSAADMTVRAHDTVRRVIRPGMSEREIAARLEYECRRAGFGMSFETIVTVKGEVLHGPVSDDKGESGDLMLLDFGAETPSGYAGDVTRTWPVAGRPTAEQRAIFELVARVQARGIESVRPGVRYLDVHRSACREMAKGLVELGLLRGEVDDIVSRGAHALFFPHGIGHLVGLDVHDLEDLGDQAGYAPGRTRSNQFGLSFLRLDRDLEQDMLVTIEPGFYWSPAILENDARTREFSDLMNRGEIERFRTVRGIRIEDEVLVTAEGSEVLTEKLPRLPM